MGFFWAVYKLVLYLMTNKKIISTIVNGTVFFNTHRIIGQFVDYYYTHFVF